MTLQGVAKHHGGIRIGTSLQGFLRGCLGVADSHALLARTRGTYFQGSGNSRRGGRQRGFRSRVDELCQDCIRFIPVLLGNGCDRGTGYVLFRGLVELMSGQAPEIYGAAGRTPLGSRHGVDGCYEGLLVRTLRRDPEQTAWSVTLL